MPERSSFSLPLLLYILAIDKITFYVIKYDYDAWGRVISAEYSDTLYTIWENAYFNAYSIGQLNSLIYKDYYYDKDLDLYYLQTRYYDPTVCRFISPDHPDYLDYESINGLNLYAYCLNSPVMGYDPTGHSWESFWNDVGNWFKDNWIKLTIGTAFIIGGAIVTALTAGAGVGAMAAFGSALLSSTIQVGISVGTSVLVGGLVSVANGGGFFDNVGDNIANAYMWGGIFSGGAQILGGGFRIAANKGVTTGRAGGIKLGNSGVKILSPDKNSWAKAGGTLIKFGNAFRIDTGAMWGLHMHILSSGHLPLGSFLAGLIGTEY